MMPSLVIHRLLYFALLEIRMEGEKTGNRLLFHVADLLYTIPLQLERVTQGEGSYDQVLTTLRQRAQQKGVKQWLNHTLEHNVRSLPDDSRAGIHELLYIALFEMRAEAHATQNDKAFCLAHLFHNTPLQLESVLEGKQSYDEIYDRFLGWVRDDTPLWGCEAWLEQAIQDATQSSLVTEQD